MSVYTQMVPYQAAAGPPPGGDSAGFNFRSTQNNGVPDQTGETWASFNTTGHQYPQTYNLEGGGTWTAGWDVTANSAFDTPATTDRRLKGGVGIAHTGNNGRGGFILATEPGTYRVRCAIGLYVQFTPYLAFWDGYDLDDPNGVTFGTERVAMDGTFLLANNFLNVNNVSRTEAQWVSEYDSVFADIVVTDNSGHPTLDTCLIFARSAQAQTRSGTGYFAHLYVEKLP